jgi:hypothetical protein
VLTRVSVNGFSFSSPRALTLRPRAADRPRRALSRWQPDSCALLTPHGLGLPRPLRARCRTARDTPGGSHGPVRRLIGDAGKAARHGSPRHTRQDMREAARTVVAGFSCAEDQSGAGGRIGAAGRYGGGVPPNPPFRPLLCACAGCSVDLWSRQPIGLSGIDRKIDRSGQRAPGSPHRTVPARRSAG